MDLFKALTGKNPAEFEQAAKILVNTPDIELFKKLVKQDEFLFDFVKNNVAKRIKTACNKSNYRNLLQFLEYYSPSYDDMIAEELITYDKDGELKGEMKNLFLNGTDAQKAYALKYFLYLENKDIEDLILQIREASKDENEFISTNSIELLSKHKDTISKENAIRQLNSEDEFEQYDAVKFLVTYGAKDALPRIFKVMKKSSLSENIAAEIPYLMNLEALLESSFEEAILVLCNIINAIPEIVPLSAIIDYNLLEIFENLYYNNLTSSSALLLRMSKEKFEALAENEEYSFDCDKNTKEELNAINEFFKGVNVNKLNSLLYDELYEDSDFVFFAVDYINDIEELETLLDSSNQTLILKVLTTLKDKNILSSTHKDFALNHITSENIRQIVELL
jgi:hypothetical protein